MPADRTHEIFSGQSRAEEIFEEIAASKGLSGASALWLYNEYQRLVSLAHDLSFAAE